MSKETKFYNKDQARELLLQTFDSTLNDEDNQQRMEILIRFIRAIDTAAQKDGLTFSGLKPNDVDKLGNYLTTSGRMFFDLSDLNEKDRKKFNDFLFPEGNSVIKPRFVATHAIEKQGDILVDKKLKPLEALWRAIVNKIFGKPSEHYGMNIGIGGAGNKTKNPEGEEVTIQNNGEFGHLYINKNEDLSGIQVGFEEAGPGKKFIPGGGSHGIDGKGAEQSHCMTHRLQDYKFGPDGSDEIIPKNDKNGPYTWNRIKVTEEMLKELENLKEDNLKPSEENVKNIKDILNAPPANCIEVMDYKDRCKKIVESRQDNGLFVKKGIDESVGALKNLIEGGLYEYNKAHKSNFFKSGGIERASFYGLLLNSDKQESNDEKEEMMTLIISYALLASTDGKTLKSEVGKKLDLSPEAARNSLQELIKEKGKDNFSDVDSKTFIGKINEMVRAVVTTANSDPNLDDVERVKGIISKGVDELTTLQQEASSNPDKNFNA